jgi:carbamoyl-phosphate synthase large subunit
MHPLAHGMQMATADPSRGSSSNAVNVLFTSAGRRVELLRAFRSALVALEVPGKIIALDADPLAPALRVADCAHIVPRITSPSYLPTLVEICRNEQATLIFPLIDPDVPFLSANREVLEATGAMVVAVGVEAASIITDKWETFRWFRRIGLPTPSTWLPGDLAMSEFRYPVFVKPRCGSASAHCFKVRDATELSFFLRYVEDPIVQEWLPGPEVTTDVICGTDGELLGIVSRQRIEARWGEVAKGVTVCHPEITAACIRIAKELPGRGPLTVQGLWSDGGFVFTEINARFGGGVPLGIAAGVDSPRWFVARAAGLPLSLPALATYRTRLKLTRFDESFIVSENDDERRHL